MHRVLSQGSRARRVRIHRFDPDSIAIRASTRMRLTGSLWPDGSGCVDPYQERDRSTLTFRRSCREGICGSCAMNIRWSQHPGVHESLRRHPRRVRIYSAPTSAVIKDLVPDLNAFLRQYASVMPWLQTRSPDATDRERLQSKADQEKIDRPSRASVRVLLDPRAELLVEQRSVPGSATSAGGVPLDHRQSR